MDIVNNEIKYIKLDTTDSTNNRAKELLSNGTAIPFCVTAKSQTAGRGRYGKDFYYLKKL